MQVDNAWAFAAAAHPAHGLVVVDSDAGHGVILMLRKNLVDAAESHRTGVAVGLFAIFLCDQNRGLLLHIVQGPDGNQHVSGWLIRGYDRGALSHQTLISGQISPQHVRPHHGDFAKVNAAGKLARHGPECEAELDSSWRGEKHGLHLQCVTSEKACMYMYMYVCTSEIGSKRGLKSLYASFL